MSRPGWFGAILGALGILLAGVSSLQIEAARPDGSGAPESSSLTANGALAVSQQPQPSALDPGAEASYRSVFNTYCVTCHNQRLATAGLMLDRMDVERVGLDAPSWEKVVRKLRARAMPPAPMRRPDPATYDLLVSWLETELDRAAAAKPNPGRPAIRRLNRTEYTNAIRDLLALEVDGESLLPADESEYGFDNIADVLSMSSGLLERYMLAAQKIGRLAIGDPTMRPAIETYRFPMTLPQDDRMSESELPFRSRGGVVIRQYLPLDGEYVLRIRLQRTGNQGVIRGLDNREELEVWMDGVRLKVFTVGGECVGSKAAQCGRDFTHNELKYSEYERLADAALHFRFPAKAGTRVFGIGFLKRSSAATEGPFPERVPVGHVNYASDADVDMNVEIVEISGPFTATGPGDTPSRRRIFVCRPNTVDEEEPCASKILTLLGRRAFRRPLTNEDMRVLLGFYQSGRREGGFEAGIRYALESLLVSPEFLFRIERDPANVPPGAPYRVSDLELASRLSFFLWSSIPDDTLLDAAVEGRLKDPAILERHVRRMLADDRASALVTNFAGQWLYLRNMKAVTPDPQTFPEFDEKLREAFQRETELFLTSQLREDRSVVELLTADYTFLNERLARLYRIPYVYGSHFRRVPLPDERRNGLLGHGSILTVTSYAHRTSPVIRGKWILENLFAAPPPAPPPNVPPLKENGDEGQAPTTVRERLELHRKNPVCASCHSQMDPLGFALENFDGIGRWRTRDGEAPIDASGVLPDGTKFNGVMEFRKALVNHREQFVGAVTEKLLTYAVGRGVEYYDMPAVRQIIREAGRADYRWSSVILGIVKSRPFQMRMAASE